jgi:hypothetical protein
MMERRILALLALALLGAVMLFAEIAPEEYEKMKGGAPEHLELSIDSVRHTWGLFSRTTYVTAKAKVTEVHRSLTRLSVGDSITITYEIYKPRKGWVGPRAIPLLKKGEETPAFLEFDLESKTYIPSARGASFESLLPVR